MAYAVHLDVFDGPFDLLLQLISAQEVDVYEVRLSELVDAFCAEIARAEHLDLDSATEFLLIAATLVELKCRRLLPDEADPELDEELSLFAARDYLLARLVECRMFTAAAASLLELERQAALSHPRLAGPDERFSNVAPDLLENVTGEMLADAVKRVLAPRPVMEMPSAHLHSEEVSVADVLSELVASLPGREATTLRELTEGASTPRIVAYFLALLELYKQELVDLVQSEHFGELAVRWTGDDDDVTFAADRYDGSEVLS